MKRADVEQTRQDADTLVNAVHQAAAVFDFLQSAIAMGSIDQDGAEVVAIAELCGIALHRIAITEDDRLEVYVRSLTPEGDG